ncbi:MAG: nucleoside hydrolase [Pseudomonadales bacterium]
MTHYILDCDPGHDDALALLVAARHLSLVGVTTVFGNSSVANTTRNAISILDAAGLSHIPVAGGAKGPLSGKLHSGETIHGKSGLDGANLPASTRQPITQSAAEFIKDQAMQFDDLVIIAVAPQTNVAQALTQYPELRDRITEISVMGGSTTHGNATAAAEFNILADPEAASIVLGSGIPVTLAGLNITTSFGLTSLEVRKLMQHSAVVTREIAGALAFNLSRQSAIYERHFMPIHDVCAVMPYSHPGLITYQPMHVAVECKGEFTRGMTVCDQRGVIAGEGIEISKPANARVAVACDGAAIVNALLAALLDYE